MVFEKDDVRNIEEINEINNAIDDFRKNYNLEKENIIYVIKKQVSPIASYFLIQPRENYIKIEEIQPKKAGYSYIENLLMNNEQETLILLNGRYFRILKQKPEDSKN